MGDDKDGGWIPVQHTAADARQLWNAPDSWTPRDAYIAGRDGDPFARSQEDPFRDAACLGAGLTAFFDEDSPASVDYVRDRMCASCPKDVYWRCMVISFSHGPHSPGIWAGLTRKNRRRIRKDERTVLCEICDLWFVPQQDDLSSVCNTCKRSARKTLDERPS